MTDDSFEGDKKGAHSHGRGHIFLVNRAVGGPHFTRRIEPGGHYTGKMGPGGPNQKRAPKFYNTIT